MLTREMAQQWVDAMVSGKFQHGVGKFKATVESGHCHCALGVLAEINNFPLTVNGIMCESPTFHNWLYETFPENGVSQIFEVNDKARSYDPVIDLVYNKYVVQA